MAPEGKKQSTAPTAKPDRRRRQAQAQDANVGKALRTVYQQTVNEDVPNDLLDLLGKLS